MKKKGLFMLLATALLASCNNEDTDGLKQDAVAVNSITEEGFIQSVKTLSSDEFLGRMPFTEGETKTINYLKDQFELIGLEPGNGGSFFQEVPLVEITSSPSGQLSISGEKGELNLTLLEDFVMGSRQLKERVEVAETELIFAGFGIVAPEYNWNDYEGLDVKGKTVVVMVNDPGFGGEDSTFFKGNTMTYYGRWTYKFEEAARQGAKGCFVVHNTVPAGYPFQVLQT